jgi:hypothetical protein
MANAAPTAAELESLLLRAAPIGRPFYVCLRSDGIPPELQNESAVGYCGASVDLAFEPMLQAQGRWRGRGVAIYVDDVRHSRQARDLAPADEEFAVALARDRIVATAAHEAAHFHAQRWLSDEAATPAAIAQATTDLARYCRTDLELTFPFSGHDANWIRAYLHLCHRIGRQGVRVPLGLGCPSSSYQLSSVGRYAAVLSAELVELADVPLDVIRDRDWPPDFRKLWHDDLARYLLMQQEISRLRKLPPIRESSAA